MFNFSCVDYHGLKLKSLFLENISSIIRTVPYIFIISFWVVMYANEKTAFFGIGELGPNQNAEFDVNVLHYNRSSYSSSAYDPLGSIATSTRVFLICGIFLSVYSLSSTRFFNSLNLFQIVTCYVFAALAISIWLFCSSVPTQDRMWVYILYNFLFHSMASKRQKNKKGKSTISGTESLTLKSRLSAHTFDKIRYIWFRS